MGKQYKVGEFAKNLGVSVGFLKHHEKYGTLTPHISPSGYRYYEYNQAMLAMQCLRLQNLGFTSKEIAHMLTHSADINIRELIASKSNEIRSKMEFYQETLKYIDFYSQSIPDAFESDPPKESWSVYTPEPFYYLENSSERQFIEDPKLQKIAAHWVEFLPMTDIVSSVTLKPSAASDLQISSWNMGMAIRKSYVESLQVPDSDKVPLITPGKCLVYHFTGKRTVLKGHEYLKHMLERPMEICRKHHFTLCDTIYQFNTFCSTAGDITYVREMILVPIAD